MIFATAACQAFPVGGATPTATVRPTAPVSTTASDSVVWARIPYCGCLYGSVATDGVSAALKKAQLAGTVKILNPTDGWLYFEVAFDPETAAREQIAAAIKAGGGEVMAGPPGW
jgi:hypothetical protein